MPEETPPTSQTQEYGPVVHAPIVVGVLKHLHVCACESESVPSNALSPPNSPHLSLFSHAVGISLVGIELYCCLTEGDEVEVPPSEDGESGRHSHTHKEHNQHQRVLHPGGVWQLHRRGNTPTLHTAKQARQINREVV